jgi:tetratricopeptide (TPR) repeat protein
MRRHATRFVVLSLVGFLALTPAVAAKKAPSEGFKLSSGIMMTVPEIADALARAKAEPGDVLLWRGLGQVLAERAAFKDAVRAFQVATKVDPADTNAWVDLGATLIRSGEVGDGITALKRALKIDSYHALAHYNLGIAYQTRSDFEDALDSFEYALTIDPALGDPTKNGGVITNPVIPIVKLRIYMKTIGSAPALFNPLTMTTTRRGEENPAGDIRPQEPDPGSVK